jgi:hypothetical protein
MPRTPLYLAVLFATLGFICLTLGLRAPASTAAGPNPARRARIRIALIFLAVAVFLFILSGAWNPLQ